MGYKAQEQIIPTARNHAQRWTEVMEKSDHTVTLIDLCGHEKYLKTTLFGLTGKTIYSYTLYIYVYLVTLVLQRINIELYFMNMYTYYMYVLCRPDARLLLAGGGLQHGCTSDDKRAY